MVLQEWGRRALQVRVSVKIDLSDADNPYQRESQKSSKNRSSQSHVVSINITSLAF